MDVSREDAPDMSNVEAGGKAESAGVDEMPVDAQRFLELIGKRLNETEERLENIAFKGLPAPLANLLLRLGDEQGSNEIVGVSHQDVAERVGTYRETATQVLNALKSQGLIEIGRKRIIILDMEKLAEIAESQ